MDRSADLHREGMMTIFGWVGLDDDLAAVLYEQDFKPASHLLYPTWWRRSRPSVRSASGRLLSSNIHFDLRQD